MVEEESSSRGVRVALGVGDRFTIDGEFHVVGPACKCHWKRCRECGGVTHRQPMYGCLFEQCEVCDADLAVPCG
jgi:hypothetical protein